MEFKTCTKCGQSLPATMEFFYRDPKNHDGLRLWCKVCTIASSRAWIDSHKERARSNGRTYYERHKAERAQWRQQNRGHIAEYRLQRRQARSPQLCLNDTLRKAMGKAVHEGKAGRSWEAVVGYTLDDLMRHLEPRFRPGMTFRNHGKWHVDHVHPLSAFSFTSTDDPQFKECWALSNLQPLWAIDNMRKHATWQGQSEQTQRPESWGKGL